MRNSTGSRQTAAVPAATATPGPANPPNPRQVPSSELFGIDRQLVIVHNGARYTLRITSNDKLILTK